MAYTIQLVPAGRQVLMPLFPAPQQIPISFFPAPQQTVQLADCSYKVCLGQDASSLTRFKGLAYNQYVCGDIVSVTRTNGGKTVGEVVSFNKNEMVVSLGETNKNIPLNLVPSLVGKLIGASL